MAPLYRRGLNGRGSTIVILIPYGSPTFQHDLDVYDKRFGLPDTKLQIVKFGKIPPFDPTDLNQLFGAAGGTWQLELTHAIAPGAKIVIAETTVAGNGPTAGLPELMAAEKTLVDEGVGDIFEQMFSTAEGTFPGASTDPFIFGDGHGNGIAGIGALKHSCRQLLKEQRVSSGHLHQAADSASWKLLAEHVADESSRLLVRHRFERDRRLGAHAASPRRPAIEQLWPGQRQQHHRRVSDVNGQIFDEVKLARIGPMNVLEHQKSRLFDSQSFDQPPCREQEEHLLAHWWIKSKSEHEGEAARDFIPLGIGENPSHRRSQLGPCGFRALLLEETSHVLDLFGEGAVHISCVVRQTSATNRAPAGLVNKLRELARQS